MPAYLTATARIAGRPSAKLTEIAGTIVDYERNGGSSSASARTASRRATGAGLAARPARRRRARREMLERPQLKELLPGVPLGAEVSGEFLPTRRPRQPAAAAESATPGNRTPRRAGALRSSSYPDRAERAGLSGRERERCLRGRQGGRWRGRRQWRARPPGRPGRAGSPQRADPGDRANALAAAAGQRPAPDRGGIIMIGATQEEAGSIAGPLSRRPSSSPARRCGSSRGWQGRVWCDSGRACAS